MKKSLKIECLYRVSSAQQVSSDGDGIPSQEKACRDYAKQNGWEIVKEYHEFGISGYHVSASKRDAIIALKEDAEAGKFDILLVYMCDRIGRISEETPYVVEWFISHGIRVVSVREGEQRIESHADKLMNFIRYWQSEGESVKTSMRVKDRMDQLRKSGNFVGGVIPYGYRKIKGKRVNKRNESTADIEIEQAEAEVIQEIFQRTVENGIAHQRIADDLTSRGFHTHNGKPFTRQTVKQILTNERYTGYIITKNVKSPFQKRLQIIDEDTFRIVQDLMAKRSIEYQMWQKSERVEENPLLRGMNICCAVCGSNITVTLPAKGAVRKKAQYICKKEENTRRTCKGQHSYDCDLVDSIIFERTKCLLREVNTFQKKTDKSIVFSNAFGRTACPHEIQRKYDEAYMIREEHDSTLVEVLKAPPEKQQEWIERDKELELLIKKIEPVLNVAKDKEATFEKKYKQGIKYQKQIRCVAEQFNEAEDKTQQSIIQGLYSKIELSRGYKVKLFLNEDYLWMIRMMKKKEFSSYYRKLRNILKEQ